MSLLPVMEDSSSLPMKTLSGSPSPPRTIASRVTHFVYSIWLFTASDVTTVIAPSVVFALMSGTALTLLLPNAGLPSPLEILSRTPLLGLYAWINTINLCLMNQRQPDSIEEDRINKPWRPLPAGRMSPTMATVLLFAFCVAAVALSTALGAPLECWLVLALGYWYNELGGAERPVLKNVLNALGIPCFSVGALQVAINPVLPVTRPEHGVSVLPLMGRWFVLKVIVILTTVHLQDLKDQEGDEVRGRKTIPIVLGSRAARWSIAIPMALWSVAVPFLWEVPLLGYVPTIAIGATAVVRVVRYRSVAADKKTFKLWCAWMVAMYCLPLVTALCKQEGLPFLVTI